MNDLTQRFLNKLQTKSLSVHCVGDTMIDMYHQVSVNRISPEFPMPIMSSTNGPIELRPGGMANVAYQLKHCNANVTMFTALDGGAAQIFDKYGLKMTGSMFIDTDDMPGRVPIKNRFLDGKTQVSRWDQEDLNKRFFLSKDDLASVLSKISGDLASTPKADVTILSDYGKGMFEDHNWMSAVKDRFTIVDPKSKPIEKWTGCTVIKPNAAESKELTGFRRCQDQCKYYREKLGCRHVFITHSGRGVSGCWDGEYFEYRSESIDAASVVGAGDCFLAYLSVALGHGFEGVDAAKIAFHAGKAYVRNQFNEPVAPISLYETKLVRPEDLKNRNFKLVFTNGCFDILHKGHLRLLSEAKKEGDKLVVAVNSDRSVRALKGASRPVVPAEHRIAVLEALEIVDYVIEFDENTPLNTIKACCPDVIVKGGDYLPENVVGADLVHKVVIVPLVEGVSTTALMLASSR